MEKAVLKPHRIRKGDLVGVISPSSPVLPSELEAGIRLLESFGYSVFTAPHVYDGGEYLAGEDGARLQDFHQMFRDSRIRAVFCARGGYGSMRFLEGIDFDLVRRNPKIFVGYSDVTALLMALYKRAGLLTFHGPMVKEFPKDGSRNLRAMLDLLSSEGGVDYDFSRGRTLLPGRAEGILLGGNLSLLCHLAGTPYMPSLKGAILFIEDTGEPIYKIDRMLTQLLLSRRLKGIAGLVAGEFDGCGDPGSIDRILTDRFSHMGIPIITQAPLGHGTENITLPIGLRVGLDSEGKTLSPAETCLLS